MAILLYITQSSVSGYTLCLNKKKQGN